MSLRAPLACLCTALLAGGWAMPAAALDIKGRVQARLYETPGDEGYGNFILLAKTGKTVFTVTPDEQGEFKFTNLSADTVSEIGWDQVAAGAYVLWPLWRDFRADIKSYDFEVRSLADLQKLAKVAVSAALESGDMQGADRILDRVLNIYAVVTPEVREANQVDRYEYVLLRDVIVSAALRRDVLGRRQVRAAMIEFERKWHRQLITDLSQVPEEPESGSVRVRRGLAACANWSEFSRKAYRPQQKRWPSLSVDAAAEKGEQLFLPDDAGDATRYRDWMLEDVLLVRDFLRDARLRELVEARRGRFQDVRGGTVLAQYAELVGAEAGEVPLDAFVALVDAVRALLALPADEPVAADAAPRAESTQVAPAAPPAPADAHHGSAAMAGARSPTADSGAPSAPPD